MVNVPNLLSCVRLLLVPVLLWLAWNGNSRTFFVCLIVSILTDATDGYLARRFNQTTNLGAKLDSWADLATSLSLPFAGWWLRPDVVRQEAPFLAAGIFLYLAAIAVGFLKFRRLTSYHTWGGKLSAIVVAAAVIVFFANGPGWPFRIAMPIVILACLEEIVITIILPERRANVPSFWHALQIRHESTQGSAGDAAAS
jgi:CDP-diacylglycerol--glycerol-3-phosphate 3-phosphatidyltransferase